MNQITGVPYQIKIEGEKISLKFNKTSPTTGRISWNIPTPSVGCDTENQAYNGLILTLDNSPMTASSVPADGKVYSADPTADRDLHAGDKIGTALVVGALYDDKTTTFIDVTGLSPSVPYYVSGYAVDLQNRYHTEGTHAYSLPYGEDEGKKTPGYQLVQLGYNGKQSLFDVLLYEGHSSGVRGGESTGLEVGINYTFDIGLNGEDKQTITINGTDAQTYNDLINALNEQFKKLGNPPEVAGYPNQNSYFFDPMSQKLYLFDGQQHNEVPVIVEGTDPSIATNGDLWFDGVLLYQYNTTTTSWELPAFFDYHKNPSNLDGNDFWFDGTQGYVWQGNTWCEKPTFNQALDPSLGLVPPHGSFWYDQTTQILYEWKENDVGCETVGQWTQTNAFYTSFDPSLLTQGDYWFNDETSILYVLDNTSTWTQVTETVYVQEDEPTSPNADEFWFVPSTEQLSQRDPTNTSWISPPLNQITTSTAQVIVWHEDPLDRDSCDLWWNSSTNELFIWNSVSSSWVLVSTFYQAPTDPTTAPTLEKCTLWRDSSEDMYSWDGSEWIKVTYIDYLNDVTNLGTSPTDDFWRDSVNDLWYKWDGTQWLQVFPTFSATDPYLLPVGSFWYNTTNNTLQQVVSIGPITWSPIIFSTTSFTPAVGFTFCNILTGELLMWNGTSYELEELLVTAGLTDNGDLVLIGREVGSGSIVCVEDIDLFGNLNTVANVNDPSEGTDPVSSVPSYVQPGVGDDGSPDERRELIYSLRAQLGEPVISVELTNYQMDTAVTSAIESLRKRSAVAYKRAFFFLDIQPLEQIYRLTNERVGFHKIVNITAAYRYQSSYLGNATGQGAYGQAMLQHLYQMGSFDLVSYHLVSEYVELMNHMFGAYLNFNWDEDTRLLQFHQTFGSHERILLDATIERTDQQLLKDRYCKTWIERYALGTAQLMLAEIRGKYGALPGAGGGVVLNAQELRADGQRNIQECYEQIENFVVNDIENHGYETTFIMG